MISENNKRFLRQIPFLSNLTEDELHDFFKHLGKPITFKNMDAICREGSKEEGSYIVLEGQCVVYKTVNKKRMVIDQVKKTQVIGEMSEFLHGTRSATIVVTSEKAKLMKISLKDLPCPLRAKIRENQCRVLAERLIKKNDSSSQLSLNILELKAIHDQRIGDLEDQQAAIVAQKDEKIKELTSELKELRLRLPR